MEKTDSKTIERAIFWMTGVSNRRLKIDIATIKENEERRKEWNRLIIGNREQID